MSDHRGGVDDRGTGHDTIGNQRLSKQREAKGRSFCFLYMQRELPPLHHDKNFVPSFRMTSAGTCPTVRRPRLKSEHMISCPGAATSKLGGGKSPPRKGTVYHPQFVE